MSPMIDAHIVCQYITQSVMTRECSVSPTSYDTIPSYRYALTCPPVSGSPRTLDWLKKPWGLRTTTLTTLGTRSRKRSRVSASGPCSWAGRCHTVIGEGRSRVSASGPYRPARGRGNDHAREESAGGNGQGMLVVGEPDGCQE